MAAIDNAKVALLLISPDFLQSQFILEYEVPKLKERSEQGELIMIPLIVRPSPWEVFDWLSPIQGYLQDEMILSGCTTHQIESTLKKLVLEIDRIVTDMKNDVDAEEEPSTSPVAIPPDLSEEMPVEERGYDLPQIKGALKDVAGFLTNAGIGDLIKIAPQNPSGEGVIGLILVFKTRKQRTWLAATGSNLFCVLDGEKTASKGRFIQWVLPLGKTDPVNVRKREGRATGLVNIGPKQNWLYSQRIHPDHETLKTNIEKLIIAGKRSRLHGSIS